MATYAWTLKRMLEGYPDLFPTEIDALHHLFFVNGNGYEWKAGQLVCSDEEPGTGVERERRMLEGFLQQCPESWYLRERLDAIKDMTNAEFVKYARTLEHERRLRFIAEGHTDWKKLPDGRIRQRLYPLCEYADILHVPENVKPDWLAAAEKALEWARGPLCRRSRTDVKWLKEAAVLLRQRRRPKRVFGPPRP